MPAGGTEHQLAPSNSTSRGGSSSTSSGDSEAAFFPGHFQNTTSIVSALLLKVRSIPTFQDAVLLAVRLCLPSNVSVSTIQCVCVCHSIRLCILSITSEVKSCAYDTCIASVIVQFESRLRAFP